MKVPATECYFVLASRGQPDAKGVRTRAAVYYQGGSPQLQFPYKSPTTFFEAPSSLSWGVPAEP